MDFYDPIDYFASFEDRMFREMEEDWEFRMSHPIAHFDFSGLKTPRDTDALAIFGGWATGDGHDDRFLVWQAAGWVWLFDTEWANRIVEPDASRIVRLQNIFGCANVSYGPPAKLKDNGNWRPGIWARRVEFQTERHRFNTEYGNLCKCKSAPYETGEIWEAT